MYLEPLRRNVRICSSAQVPGILEKEPQAWNVLALTNPDQRYPDLSLAKSSLAFPVSKESKLSTKQIAQIFLFCESKPGPLLIYCASGISHSPSILLLLLLGTEEVTAGECIRLTKAVRGIAKLNAEILATGLKYLGCSENIAQFSEAF